MRILIMHTLPPEQCLEGRWEWEFDLHDTAHDIKGVLPEASVVGVHGVVVEMIDVLTREAPDVVFNLCEAPLADPRLESHAAALFEWMRLPFTGSGSTALALCRRKDLAKQLLSAAGVLTPRSGCYPCIVKPVDEDGSAGIRADSVCTSPAEVDAARARLHCAALVEEYLPGREFAVTLWGAREPDHAVVGEIAFGADVRVISYEGKWDMESHDYVNAPLVFDRDLDPELRGRVVDTAQSAWRVLGLRGYATVDLRLDAEGCPRVIDVNPNPALNAEGRVARALAATPVTWADFVQQQVQWAL
jgi:D-alanine-D-alanine ligase